MSEEGPKTSRFRRVRDVGGNIKEAFDTVSGRSISEDMDEFSDAYADVLQGVHTDVESLKRKVEAIPDRRDEEAHAELNRLKKSIEDSDKKLRVVTIVAVASIGLAVVSMLLAVLS